MNKPKYKRKLSSIRYTLPFNARYLGLWVTTSLFLLMLINALSYLLIRAYWAGDNGVEGSDFAFVNSGFVVILIIMMLIEGVGVLMLAIATTHRIAGPWVQVQKVCEAVSAGNPAARMHFRQYDGLDHIATAFNTMMDKLNERDGAPAKPDAPPG